MNLWAMFRKGFVFIKFKVDFWSITKNIMSTLIQNFGKTVCKFTKVGLFFFFTLWIKHRTFIQKLFKFGLNYNAFKFNEPIIILWNAFLNQVILPLKFNFCSKKDSKIANIANRLAFIACSMRLCAIFSTKLL